MRQEQSDQYLHCAILSASFGCITSWQSHLAVRSVSTLCHSVCFFWMHYFMAKPPCSQISIYTVPFCLLLLDALLHGKATLQSDQYLHCAILSASFGCITSWQSHLAVRSVSTLCHSVCFFWMHYFMAKPPCSQISIYTVPLCLLLLDALLHGKATLFELLGDYSKFFMCPNF